MGNKPRRLTMSETKLTATQKHDIYQKIWSLRNKMVEKLNELEYIHSLPFPTVGDGVQALHIVHKTWDSKEYNELEALIKEVRGE